MKGPLCFSLAHWLKQDWKCIRLQAAEDVHPTVYRMDEKVVSVYKDTHHPAHVHVPRQAVERGAFAHHA